MFFYEFSFRSLTAAQQGRNVLSGGAISAELLRAPRAIAVQGCAFVLRVRAEDGLRAADLLRAWQSRFLRVFRVYENGYAEEAVEL